MSGECSSGYGQTCADRASRRPRASSARSCPSVPAKGYSATPHSEARSKPSSHTRCFSRRVRSPRRGDHPVASSAVLTRSANSLPEGSACVVICPPSQPTNAPAQRVLRPSAREGIAPPASGVTALALVDVAADVTGDSQRPLRESKRSVPLPVARPLSPGDRAGAPRLVERGRAGRPVFVDVEGSGHAPACPFSSLRARHLLRRRHAEHYPSGARPARRPARQALRACCRRAAESVRGAGREADPPGPSRRSLRRLARAVRVLT